MSHNASFDRRILMLEFERVVGTAWTRPHLCTLKLARALYPKRKESGRGYSLAALARDLQVQHAPTHRAAADVFTNVLVMWRMLQAHGHRRDIRDVIRACTVLSTQPR